MSATTITYTGWAYDPDGQDTYLDGDFVVEDEQPPEPDVGIFHGCVWVQHPDFSEPVEIPHSNLMEYYKDYNDPY